MNDSSALNLLRLVELEYNSILKVDTVTTTYPDLDDFDFDSGMSDDSADDIDDKLQCLEDEMILLMSLHSRKRKGSVLSTHPKKMRYTPNKL